MTGRGNVKNPTREDGVWGTRQASAKSRYFKSTKLIGSVYGEIKRRASFGATAASRPEVSGRDAKVAPQDDGEEQVQKQILQVNEADRFASG
jgi:hypothetical protein